MTPSLRAVGALSAALALAACGPKQDDAASAAASGAGAAASAPAAAASITPNPLPPLTGTYTIKAEKSNNKPGTEVVLMNAGARAKDEPIAKAKVGPKGAFEITGHTDKPLMVTLYYPAGLWDDFVLENANYTYASLEMAPSASAPASAAGAKKPAKGAEEYLYLTGGQWTEKVFGYRFSREYTDALQKEGEAYDRIVKGVDPNNEAKMKEAERLLEESGVQAAREKVRHDALAKQFEDTSLPAVIRAFILTENDDMVRYPEDKRKALFAALEQEAGPHPVFDKRRERIAQEAETKKAQEKVAIGQPFIDLTLKDKDGKDHKLSDVVAKNKFVLLDFWASWCGPCRAEFPHLKKTYAKYHDQGFEIYGISADENRADWIKAMKEENTPWINVIEPKFDKGGSLDAYGVDGLPSNFLIGADGKIVAAQLRDFDLARIVGKAFGDKSVTEAPAK